MPEQELDGLNVFELTWYSAFDEAEAFVGTTGPWNRDSVGADSFQETQQLWENVAIGCGLPYLRERDCIGHVL